MTPINLSARGYVEQEYFLSGKANVYDLDASGKLLVKSADVPYVNRIIMRWPKDPAKFSGNVIVEINNASALVDKPVVWAESHDYLIRNGDAYVAVTSKPVSVRSIKAFNLQRYEALSWPNPKPENCANLPADSTIDMENGLIWDIIGQTGAFVRDKSAANNPLVAAGLVVQQVYLTGQLQSANMTRTYYNNFHVRDRLSGNRPIFSGYLVYASSGVIQPINNCAAAPSGTDPRNLEHLPTDVPVIYVQSKSSSELFGSRVVTLADSDDPQARFRRIEVAGASHLDAQFFLNQSQDADVLAAGRALQLPCAEWRPDNATGSVVNDFPMHFIIDSSFKNLDPWQRAGTAPPKAPTIHILNAGTPTAALEKVQRRSTACIVP